MCKHRGEKETVFIFSKDRVSLLCLFTWKASIKHFSIAGVEWDPELSVWKSLGFKTKATYIQTPFYHLPIIILAYVNFTQFQPSPLQYKDDNNNNTLRMTVL